MQAVNVPPTLSVLIACMLNQFVAMAASVCIRSGHGGWERGFLEPVTLGDAHPALFDLKEYVQKGKNSVLDSMLLLLK